LKAVARYKKQPDHKDIMSKLEKSLICRESDEEGCPPTREILTHLEVVTEALVAPVTGAVSDLPEPFVKIT
jgi:hypothetical protein